MTSAAAPIDDLTIREAVPEDASALAMFAERSFRDAFERDNAPSDMAQYVASAFGDRLQKAEIADSRRTIFLADTGNAIAGYAQLLNRSAPAEVGVNPAMELERFYVGRQWHGLGVAQLLMKHVITAASQCGAAALWLGVWERNGRAISFYRRSGFVDVGSQPFMLGSDLQTDRIMCRLLRD